MAEPGPVPARGDRCPADSACVVPDLPPRGALRLTDVLGACVAALDPALPGAREEARARLGIGPAPQVLVLLVDGLGWVPLEARLGHAPVLRSHREDTTVVHTVVPSTTAAAITSFATGRLPGATRMVGYSVRAGGDTMKLLAFAEGVDPVLWQPCDTTFERLARVGVESAVVSPAAFAGSGLTRAALRGARHVGASGWDQRIRAALRELRAGTPLVYLYWSDIDHTGHHHGVGSEEWTNALEEFDAGLRMLLAGLPEGVRAVLTADHGMVDTSPEWLLDLATRPDLDEGVAAIAGEARCVHVHARAGRGPEVLQRWRDVLADVAWVWRPGEMAEVLGEGPGSAVVGDALVLMRGHHGVVDSRVQSAGSIAQVGVHGSLTSDEMLVPVMRLA
nr:nucleotide pyrophosphatase/phosphodiesterase family protein [Actinomyces polynesiensis]